MAKAAIKKVATKPAAKKVATKVVAKPRVKRAPKVVAPVVHEAVAAAPAPRSYCPGYQPTITKVSPGAILLLVSIVALVVAAVAAGG